MQQARMNKKTGLGGRTIGATKSALAFAGIAATLALLPASAKAHDPGLSAVEIRATPESLVVQLSLALVDLDRLVGIDTDGDGTTSSGEFATARPRLEKLAAEAIVVWLADDELQARNVAATLEPGNAVSLFVEFARTSDGPLRFRSGLISQLPRGHRQFVSVKGGDGTTVAEKLVSANDAELECLLELNSTSNSGLKEARAFVVLGVEHIVTGYDHLTFLFALLIGGVTLRGAFGIITSFTVAHSITLAFATLGIVSLSGVLVECVIALSIVYIGVENFFRRDKRGRWLLTFGFGLIHGLGFATALRELLIRTGGSSAAIPLLSFNLGVELGQVAIAALLLPLILRLKTRPNFAARLIPACSLVVVALGSYWLIKRALL